MVSGPWFIDIRHCADLQGQPKCQEGLLAVCPSCAVSTYFPMVSKRELLEALVRLSGDHGRPVTTSELSSKLDTDPAAIRDRIGSLMRYELVKRFPHEPGYVPTITGRELLELDIEDEFVIVEFPDGDTETG